MAIGYYGNSMVTVVIAQLMVTIAMITITIEIPIQTILNSHD